MKQKAAGMDAGPKVEVQRIDGRKLVLLVEAPGRASASSLMPVLNNGGF